MRDERDSLEPYEWRRRQALDACRDAVARSRESRKKPTEETPDE